jgi:hypothetical protein
MNIGKEEYGEIAGYAHEYAQQFLGTYLRPDDDLTIRGDAVTPSPLMNALVAFVQDAVGCHIIEAPLPHKDYASWLCFDKEDRISIALDIRQMGVWQGQNGMPVDLQKNRSLLHELGHVLLSPAVPDNAHEAAGAPLVKPVKPDEEERAWIFAMSFLTAVLADYAQNCRSGPGPECDMTPKARV